MTGLLSVFVILAAMTSQCFTSWAQSNEGDACLEDGIDYLSLDYWTFDQDPDRGWRAISMTPGCELAAADLIAEYHRNLRERGEPVIVDHEQGTHTISPDGVVFLLFWHEGQIRAFEGQTQRAIDLFRKSIKPESNNRFGWNEYALASIAFLEKDLDELKTQRALLEPKDYGIKINLGVVDGLIACFGKSYEEAYGSEECNRRPTQ